MNGSGAQMEFVIKGGRVIDPSGETFADVLVSGGEIVAVGPELHATRVVDASGCVVSSGLVDLHAHLREPGDEDAETIESASRAAALGGYTSVLAMPNTDPCIDSASVVRYVRQVAQRALCGVEIAGAITVGREGTQLSPMGELAELGVRIFTDDGRGVQNARLMRRAMEYASGLGVTLAQHCEVAELSAGSAMHEGEMSAVLGIAGQPSETEELMVMRDIALVRMTGVRLHFQHLSTAGSVAMVQAAKDSGLPVTGEVTPHHFTLTDEACSSFDPVFRVNPPLRPSADVEQIREGLRSGAIDAIATDHAPHAPQSKEQPFDEAPPGMLGLEYALALALTELDLPISRVLELMSWNPAAIAGITATNGGRVVAGRRANLCIIDPDATWTIDGSGGASRSSNVAYAGRTVRGRVRHTIFHGEVVVLDGEAQR